VFKLFDYGAAKVKFDFGFMLVDFASVLRVLKKPKTDVFGLFNG